jgi:hypothetical protein
MAHDSFLCSISVATGKSIIVGSRFNTAEYGGGRGKSSQDHRSQESTPRWIPSSRFAKVEGLFHLVMSSVPNMSFASSNFLPSGNHTIGVTSAPPSSEGGSRESTFATQNPLLTEIAWRSAVASCGRAISLALQTNTAIPPADRFIQLWFQTQQQQQVSLAHDYYNLTLDKNWADFVTYKLKDRIRKGMSSEAVLQVFLECFKEKEDMLNVTRIAEAQEGSPAQLTSIWTAAVDRLHLQQQIDTTNLAL